MYILIIKKGRKEQKYDQKINNTSQNATETENKNEVIFKAIFYKEPTHTHADTFLSCYSFCNMSSVILRVRSDLN
jgi:hypothetical protein